MNTKSIVENRILIALGAFIFTLIFIILEYFNGGVITHHFLAREDLPGFSNWWGLFAVPLLAWIVSSMISLRRRRNLLHDLTLKGLDKQVIIKFLISLIFGATISILWKLDLEIILPYLILLPLLVAFFKPVHHPEYLLGFVLGMIYSFGGILPIIIGCILLVLCLIINKLVQLVRSVVLPIRKNEH